MSCILNLNERPGLLRRFQAAFLVWLPASLLGFLAKFWFLDSPHGFANVAGALSVKALSFGQRLSFFRADLLFALALIPVCFLLGRLLLPNAWYSWTAGTVIGIAVLLQLLAFAELAVLGNLAAPGLLAEGFEWGIDHPAAALEFLFAYNPFSSPRKAAVLGGATTLLVILAWQVIKYWRRAARKRVYFVATALWIVCAPLALASWLPWMRPTFFHSPMILLVVRSLFASDSGASKYQGLPIDALRTVQGQLMNAPGQVSPGPYWGAAKDYDVVFVVMETGPAHILMPDATFNAFPTLKRLSQSAWVGMQHYSTSPESYKAVSSILLSMYPPSHTRSFAVRAGQMPGLIPSLRSAGYRTGIYLPNVHGTLYAKQEENYYKTLDPDRVSIPDMPQVHDTALSGWLQNESLDLAALHELEDDFRASTGAGRRFFGIYLPQLSHEPWADVSSGGEEHNMAMRRINLMNVEDRHLGELLDSIARLGRLNRTLIVVVCDHGLRSSHSDSSFREGQVDDLTFHVPFLLYAPGILKAQTNVPWVTSHIDISPTILSLLGISEGREFEAGTPIWDAALKDRCIFFFASQYFGADGDYCRGSFSMYNPLLNVAYTGRTLHFTASEAVPLNSQTAQSIVARFRAMDALRNAWYESASSRAPTPAAPALASTNR